MYNENLSNTHSDMGTSNTIGGSIAHEMDGHECHDISRDGRTPPAMLV